MKITSILLPTDFSGGSLMALEHAAQISKTYGSTLHLLHVVYDITWASELYVSHAEVTRLYSQIQESAMDQLKVFGLSFRDDSQAIAYSVVRGLPHEEILRFAEEKKIDLIVIGAHGSSGVAKVVFGSTAMRVVRHAECPVLSVRAKR